MRSLPVFLILAATSLVFAPVVQNGFINRDDPDYIAGNHLIREFSGENILRIFTTPEYMGNYHPLTLTLLAAEYRLFGTREAPYHIVSLLLHLLATLLVYLLARDLSGDAIVAFGTGLLFGVHPVHVESVAWASEQKDLLYALFYLMGLFTYLRYLSSGLRRSFYAVTLGLFVLSLLSKAMAASFPLALFLIDALRGRRPDRRMIMEKLPFLCLSLLFGLLAIHAQEVSGAIVDAVRLPFGSRLGAALIALPRYLVNLIYPAKLSAFYPYPDFSLAGTTLEIAGAVILLAGLSYLAYRTQRMQPLIWFGLALFGVSLALVLQIIPVGGAMMADRYMYLPSFGLLLALVGALLIAGKRFPFGRRLLLGVILAAGLGLSAATLGRVGIWRDSVTLWTDLIGQQPGLSFPYVYRANARALPAEADLAMRDFGTALAIDSTLGFGYSSRAYAFAVLGRHEEALADYTKALSLGHDAAQALNGRGSSWAALGRWDEAVADYTRSIELKPGFADPYYNRGNVFAARNDYPHAIADYNVALTLNPADAETQAHRGLARLLAGDRGGCDDLRAAASAGITQAAEALSTLCR